LHFLRRPLTVVHRGCLSVVCVWDKTFTQTKPTFQGVGVLEKKGCIERAAEKIQKHLAEKSVYMVG